MTIYRPTTHGVVIACLAIAVAGGCQGHGKHMFYQEPPPPPVLGTYVDNPLEIQEENAEASKFVIYDHEFQLTEAEDGKMKGTYYLNEDGEDHVRKIAANLREGVPYPVIIERSRSSAKRNTVYKYPVHRNVKLDNQRRAVVVKSLQAMGIANADELVVVAPALAPGLSGFEAERAYRSSTTRFGFGSGSGGFFGGLGFGGGFGGGVGF